VEDYHQINRELASFDTDLGGKPQILAANKIDIPEAEEALARVRALADAEGLDFFPVSAVTRKGVRRLVGAMKQGLERLESS
jgi:GTP-binding protein